MVGLENTGLGYKEQFYTALVFIRSSPCGTFRSIILLTSLAEHEGLKTLELRLDDCSRARSNLMSKIRCIGVESSDLIESLHAAIVLKEHGEFEGSRLVFERGVEKWEGDDQFSFEYIQFLRHSRDHARADDFLENCVNKEIVGDNIVRELLVSVYVDFARGEAADHLTSTLRKALSLVNSPYLSAVDLYLSMTSHSARGLPNFSKEPGIENLQAIYDRCSGAISARTPFTLVRLGDGEGAYLGWNESSQAERLIANEHRAFFAQRWFGDASLATDSTFLSVGGDIFSKLHSADVIGIPTISWIKHESKLRNLRTLINCLQIMRIAMNERNPCPFVGSTTVSIDLAYHGFMERLICQAGDIILITSHTELAPTLERNFDVRIASVFLIPPAFDDREITCNRDSSSHYRQTFSGLISTIDLIRSGQVFLVSAGFLGKAYALRIKAGGGIAIDIGSLSDLWLGYRTRPNFDCLSDRLRLKRERNTE